jgi:hypothetical protein
VITLSLGPDEVFDRHSLERAWRALGRVENVKTTTVKPKADDVITAAGTEKIDGTAPR